jgi:hypothetical protein
MSLLAASLGHGGLPGLRDELARAVLGGKIRLGDGSTGYYIRLPRTDDCWAAAIATCLQVPIEEVPDPRLDEKVNAGEDPEEVNRSAWEDMHSWLEERGLRMVIHRKSFPRGRWVGVTRAMSTKPAGWFASHCLVMVGNALLFDPKPHLSFFQMFEVADIRWGFSFQETTI